MGCLFIMPMRSGESEWVSIYNNSRAIAFRTDPIRIRSEHRYFINLALRYLIALAMVSSSSLPPS
jgi:hypothetical protein